MDILCDRDDPNMSKLSNFGNCGVDIPLIFAPEIVSDNMSLSLSDNLGLSTDAVKLIPYTVL